MLYYHPRIYSVPSCMDMNPKEYADRLKKVISTLPDFYAEICPICDGQGEYKQTYTHGCGMGYYQSVGVCDYCDGAGLIMNDKPAPDSVHNQIMVKMPEMLNDC